MNTIYKRAYTIGLVCYLVLAVFSIVFYKERTIFTDISYHIFTILRTNTFAVQNMRFGAMLTQLFPLLSYKAGLSLDHIMLIYSIGFAIFYTTCYVMCGSILKRYDIALVLLLFNTLFVADTFYWIQSELPQGIAFMTVCFAYASSTKAFKPAILSYILLGMSVIVIVYFHPLIVFPFYYTICFLLLTNETPARRKVLLGMGVFFLLTLIVKNLVFVAAYDKQSMEGAKSSLAMFPHYVHLYSNKRFLQHCFTKFYWIPIAGVANIIALIVLKKWWKLLLFLCFSGGFLLLVNASYPNPGTTSFYIENLYLPLGIFISLPFIFDVLPLLQKRKLAVIAIALIAITGCARIYAWNRPYTTRLNWERNMLHNKPGQKLLILEQRVPMDTMIMTWGTGYEFWLLSTTENYKTASIVIIDNPDTYMWASDSNKSFIVRNDIFSYKVLPKKYFHFTDTTSGYTLIK